ncbi:endophilin-A3b [Lates japonicus]|uniref:Endophilin-A3b n=1 Tax=Lates japonicus TaxID=270547 RepID=A0AAD3MY71_LATJO|nr:endophilin-A3b [Lates japonicus]
MGCWCPAAHADRPGEDVCVRDEEAAHKASQVSEQASRAERAGLNPDGYIWVVILLICPLSFYYDWGPAGPHQYRSIARSPIKLSADQDLPILFLSQSVAVIHTLLFELLSKTTEFLQPSPAYRAKLSILQHRVSGFEDRGSWSSGEQVACSLGRSGQDALDVSVRAQPSTPWDLHNTRQRIRAEGRSRRRRSDRPGTSYHLKAAERSIHPAQGALWSRLLDFTASAHRILVWQPDADVAGPGSWPCCRAPASTEPEASWASPRAASSSCARQVGQLVRGARWAIGALPVSSWDMLVPLHSPWRRVDDIA